MDEKVRLAELLGTLSFAGDLGRGQPMGHVLRTTRIAMALAERLALPSASYPDVYYTSLLLHAGCTAGAANFAAFIASDELSAQKDFCLCNPDNLGELLGWMRRNVARGKPLPARTLRMLQLMASGEKAFQDVDQGCSEVGSRIAGRLGMPEGTQLALYHICESWSGKGPHRLKGDDIPLAGRIVNAAMIAEVFHSERGLSSVGEAAAARRGKSFDPSVADAVIELSGEASFWDSLRDSEPWSAVLELEPAPRRYVDEAGLDDFAYALADIVDLKSSTTEAHSRRTADLAERVAKRMQLSGADVSLSRRAALAHDVGLVGVPGLLLEKGAKWTEADRERFQLHTYYTERVLSQSEALAAIGAVASAHHEEIDGSGYHRRLSAGQLSLPARVVAAASAYVEAEELGGAEPDAVLARVKTGRRPDPDVFAALAAEVGAAKQVSPGRRTWPAGLTEREVEVVRLAASGMTLKDVAKRLVISDHTARHHLESIYGKAGVSSRAGLTLFAVENGLII